MSCYVQKGKAHELHFTSEMSLASPPMGHSASTMGGQALGEKPKAGSFFSCQVPKDVGCPREPRHTDWQHNKDETGTLPPCEALQDPGVYRTAIEPGAINTNLVGSTPA